MRATKGKVVPLRVVQREPELQAQPDGTVCEWCQEAPPRVRLNLTDLQGALLDDAEICADCARGVNMQPGEGGLHG
jgi:hypothetical protein